MAPATIADSRAVTPARRTPSLATLDERLTADEIRATLGYAEASRAANTRTAYAGDWSHFVAWCGERDATPLPCPPGLLCGYLSALASAGLRASTISRRASGIAHLHRMHGHEPPTNAEAVKAVLRGIRRELGTAPRRKAPATHDIIAMLLAGCGERMKDKRDRALLALGFAGAFRRSELLALEVADLVEVPDGLRVTIRHSKTDQAGEGQEVAIPRGAHLRPVEAVQTWLAAAEISAGPVFRPVSQRGIVAATALGDDGFVRMLKRRIAALGLDPATFSGHSLRSGFLTSAADASPVAGLVESGQRPPGWQRQADRSVRRPGVIPWFHAAGADGADRAAGLPADLCRTQRSFGPDRAAPAIGARADLGAAQERPYPRLQWSCLLSVVAAGNAAVCSESRGLPHLGSGSSLRGGSGHRRSCHAAAPQVLLAG